MLHFTVVESLCNRCGECSRDCVAGIIEQEADRLPFIRAEKEQDCIRCQHCLAVCPTAAISIHGRVPGDSQPIDEDNLPRLEPMLRLVRGRRSVRRYEAENVAPALIRKLLSALANVPMGANRFGLTFIVIDDKRVMKRLQEEATATLAVVFAQRVPGKDWFLDTIAPVYLEKGPDTIFRGAPHLLLVSALPEAFCANEDIILALAYFELLARSAGLGTLWCGMLKELLERVPAVKQLLGLPPGHPYYPMLFGLPAIRYYRTVQREDAASIRIVAL